MFTQKLNTLTPGSNFQIFYAAFTQRRLGVISSTILVTINHLQINMFLYQSFYQVFPSDHPVLEFLDTLTHYFYMENIISFSKTVYFVFRIIAWIVNISYFLVYLLMQICHHKNFRVQSLEQLFTLFNTYYAMILLLPSMEILFKEVVCDQTILQPLDQECLEGMHIFVFTISLLSIFAGLGMSFLSIFYSQNGIYDKKNYLSGENRGYEGFIALVKAILGVTVTIQNDSETFLQIYYVVNLCSSLVIVIYFGVFFPYNKLFIEQVSLFWLAVYLAQSVSMVISCFSDMTDLMAGLPFLGFIVASIIGLNFLYTKRKETLVFKTTVSSNSELQKKVQNILQLKQSEKLYTNQELFFRGVVSTHMNSCIDPSCFCKKTELFDPKKNRSFELEKWPVYKSMMLKYYVSFLFEQQIQKGGSDPDLLIAYAQFLFEKFRNTHLALTQIIKVTNSGIFLYPHQRNKIFKIRRRIFEYVSARNQEALDISLGIEDAIFVEEQFFSVLEQMRKIMQASIAYWGYLSGREVDLDKMQVLVETLCKSVDAANVMWAPLKPYLHKHKKLMYYYNWYMKEFLNKRVLLSEEGVDELFDEEKMSIYSQDFISVLKDDNVIFHDDTPIVHMSGNYTDLGKIIKVNRATLKVFGYNRDELEKASVNILMPKITATRHNYYLECFAKTGKSKTLYTQKKTFAKDKEGFIFRLWIIVKQLNNLQGLIQYVGILRPMSEKKDGHNYYIQFNDYGEVGGICRNFGQFFNQVDPQLHSKRFNLVLFAPKIIKYLFFRQFMLDQKEKEEGSNYSPTSKMDKMDIMDADTDSPGGMRLQDTPKSARLRKKKNDAKAHGADENRLYELQDFLDLDALPEEDKDNESDGEKAVAYTSKNEKIIEFTFRIPSKPETWIKEFDELKTRPQALINSNHLGEHKLMLMNSFDSSRSLLERPHGESMRPAPMTAFSSSKHAFDSYLAALKIVSHKISKAKSVNVYKMKAVFGCDKNGPDEDIVKYLKVTEISKVSNRKSTIDSANQSPDKNKEFRSLNSNGSFSEVHRDSMIERRHKRDPSVKPIKMSLFSTNRGENMVIKKVDVSDIESMESDNETAALENGDRPSKSPKPEKKEIIDDDDDESDGDEEKSLQSAHSKSSKDDEKEGGSQGSDGESVKQAVVNELKNTLINQFQSMYHKEENTLIDKDCKSLRRLRWCTYILFLTIIPINLCFFLFSTNNAFSHLDDAVTDVYFNEKIRKDFLNVHDAILTILLNNTGKFENITKFSMSDINELVNQDLVSITDIHDEISELTPQDEWTEVLYDYAPLVQPTQTLIYAGNNTFTNQTMTIQIAFWKMANSLADITLYSLPEFLRPDSELSFFRRNCLEMFNDIFYRTSIKLFDSITDTFDNTKSLAIWCLVTEAVVLVASLIIILALITVVTQSLKEILKSFTAIDNQSIRETENYYKRLLNFFNISQAKYVENDTAKIPIKNNTSGMLARQNTNANKFEKKLKKVVEQNFMKNYTRKTLAYYVVATIICIIMLVVFDVEIHNTLNYADTMLSDARLVVTYNTVYISSLIGLKSLFLDQSLYSRITQHYLTETIALLKTTPTTTSIKSDSTFGDLAREVYGGKVCDSLKPLFTTEENQECRTFANSKLSLGLVLFHTYYRDFVVDALEQADPSFGSLNISDAYEYGQVIKIIDNVLFDTMLRTWRDDMNDYMDSQQDVLLVMIIGLNVVNAIVFYWAQRGVLKSLNTKFLFYRKVYNRYMLADALMKEKRIKARLMKFQLLNK